MDVSRRTCAIDSGAMVVHTTCADRLWAPNSSVGPRWTATCFVPRLGIIVPNSFLLLVVRPGAPSSVLAPSSDALCS